MIMSGLKRLDKILRHHQGITFEVFVAVTDQNKLHSEGADGLQRGNNRN